MKYKKFEDTIKIQVVLRLYIIYPLDSIIVPYHLIQVDTYVPFGTSEHTHVYIEFDTNFRFLLKKDLPRMQNDRHRQRIDEK